MYLLLSGSCFQRPEASDSLELELQMVVSHPMRVLGFELWSSGRVTRACISYYCDKIS